MCKYTLIIYVPIHKYINTVSFMYTHTVTMENRGSQKLLCPLSPEVELPMVGDNWLLQSNRQLTSEIGHRVGC